MANKIQDALDKNGKDFSHFKSTYAPNRLKIFALYFIFIFLNFV